MQTGNLGYDYQNFEGMIFWKNENIKSLWNKELKIEVEAHQLKGIFENIHKIRSPETLWGWPRVISMYFSKNKSVARLWLLAF